MPPRESISASSSRSIHNPSPPSGSLRGSPVCRSGNRSAASPAWNRHRYRAATGRASRHRYRCAFWRRAPAAPGGHAKTGDEKAGGWRSVEERRAFAVHCTRWLSCKRQDLGSKEWRKLLTVLSQSAIRVEKIRVWFLSGTASAHQPQGDRTDYIRLLPLVERDILRYAVPLFGQPRRQVAVACWATNTGWRASAFAYRHFRMGGGGATVDEIAGMAEDQRQSLVVEVGLVFGI